MLTRVVNLASDEEKSYTLDPVSAVIAAYAQERGDFNSWDYAEKYGDKVTEGRVSVCCGDWAALKAEYEHKHTRAERVKLLRQAAADSFAEIEQLAVQLLQEFYIKEPKGFVERFKKAYEEQRRTIVGLYKDFVGSVGQSRRQLQNAIYNTLEGWDSAGVPIPHWSNLLVEEETQ